MMRISLAFVLLLPGTGYAETGRWRLEDSNEIFIVGTTIGGSLSGAYRITNESDEQVRLCLNECKRCPTGTKEKAGTKGNKIPILQAHSSVDLFVSSCLLLQRLDNGICGGQTSKTCPSGTYENLSPVSAPSSAP